MNVEVRRRLGFLAADLAFYPRLTGRAVLDHLAALRGGVDRRVLDSLVERFDADLDRPVRELSSGSRQKLGLVQAFMHEPELLILGEPISGLDPLVQRSFHALLAEVSGQGRTVFLSSHTLSEVERRPGWPQGQDRPELARGKVTLRLDGYLAHVIRDGVLAKTLPSPVPADQRAKLRGARIADGPLRAPAPGPVSVQRKVPKDGVIMITRQRLRVGTTWAGKIVTVHVEDTTSASPATAPR